MKFGQEFKTALRNSDFPPEWTASAISYSQLKKCINRLSDELKQVGLDPKTLNKLLRHVDEYNATADAEDKFRPFEYILSAGSTSRTFEPKLLFCIDDATGALHRAQLDTETKDKLQMLAAATGISELSVFEDGDHECDAHGDAPEASTDPQTTMTSAITNDSSRSGHRTIAVPLTSDVEFFTKLTTELSGLETLQEKENRRMNTEIHDLARQITHVTDPDRKANKKLLTVWRQIFQLYVEEDIFFGQTERDHSARNAQEATARFQHFTEKVDKAGLVGSIKKKESQAALNMFFHINRELLQALRFGEINTTAMTKILKKFDKRTALGVKSTLQPSSSLTTTIPPLNYPQFSQDLAKAVCAAVSTQILSHIPKKEDYICPMCFEIKWRPVKLRCRHIFCIRCLVDMQALNQHKCPLCRDNTVMEANSDNLDPEMAAFLKKWFPDEVKAKQKENEELAGVDAYGETYKTYKCAIM